MLSIFNAPEGYRFSLHKKIALCRLVVLFESMGGFDGVRYVVQGNAKYAQDRQLSNKTYTYRLKCRLLGYELCNTQHITC